MIFENYMRAVQDLKTKIPEFAKDILLDNKDVIIGLLQGQLTLGENKWGMPLAWEEDDDMYGNGYYAESTEKYWAASDLPIRPKRAGSPYNFQWTGDTFAMMDVDVQKDEFDIFSRDGKFQMLKKLYTREAFELSPEHNEMINDQMLMPLLEEKLSDALADIV